MAVVRQSGAARNGLFAFVQVALAVALLRGITGADTSGGRVAVAVFMGGFSVAWALGWRQASRQRSWLEISASAIVLRTHAGAAPEALRRADGAELQLVLRGSYRYRHPALVRMADGATLRLPWYGRKQVADAVTAHGWHLVG